MPQLTICRQTIAKTVTLAQHTYHKVGLVQVLVLLCSGLAAEVEKISSRNLDVMSFWRWFQKWKTINPRRIDLGNFWVWLQKAKFAISAATICLRRRRASDHKVENAPQCSRTCNRKTKDSLTKHMGAVEQGRLKQRANEQRQLVRTGRKETKRETHRHEHSRNLGPSVQGEDQESMRTETAFPNRQRENKSRTHGDEH